MSEKFFAFESDEVSIAFPLTGALGDAIIAKKILSAVLELSPNCLIDVFCLDESNKIFVRSFYSDIKNLNLILPYDEHYKIVAQNYDLILNIAGTWAVFLNCNNPKKLQVIAPALFQTVKKVGEYNKINVHGVGSSNVVSLRNFAMSRILNENLYGILSCGGVLPIRDDKVKIPLAPKYKAEFERLNLGNYITIYSDIERDIFPPKVKAWPIRKLVEYVALVKKFLPQIEIVQCGGSWDAKVDNADRHFLGVDLELTKYILANSLLHVGCEGGLIHLATALGTKCVVLFGFNSVNYFGYNRNINIVSKVCYPCANVWHNGMSRICIRGAKEPPCMLNITPQTVCSVTCNYISHLGLKNNS